MQTTMHDFVLAQKTMDDFVLPQLEFLPLSKHFGDIRAVDGISFEVKTGELFGFLGPNGAGKTEGAIE